MRIRNVLSFFFLFTDTHENRHFHCLRNPEADGSFLHPWRLEEAYKETSFRSSNGWSLLEANNMEYMKKRKEKICLNKEMNTIYKISWVSAVLNDFML